MITPLSYGTIAFIVCMTLVVAAQIVLALTTVSRNRDTLQHELELASQENYEQVYSYILRRNQPKKEPSMTVKDILKDVEKFGAERVKEVLQMMIGEPPFSNNMNLRMPPTPNRPMTYPEAYHQAVQQRHAFQNAQAQQGSPTGSIAIGGAVPRSLIQAAMDANLITYSNNVI